MAYELWGCEYEVQLAQRHHYSKENNHKYKIEELPQTWLIISYTIQLTSQIWLELFRFSNMEEELKGDKYVADIKNAFLQDLGQYPGVTELEVSLAIGGGDVSY